MELPPNTCENLSTILKGKAKYENEVCSVTIDRTDIEATIGSKPFHSLKYIFHFESFESGGNALITGELVLLEDEVPKIAAEIADAGILVSAIHSHWLFDTPKLMYLHLEAIMNPMTFASSIAKILKR